MNTLIEETLQAAASLAIDLKRWDGEYLGIFWLKPSTAHFPTLANGHREQREGMATYVVDTGEIEEAIPQAKAEALMRRLTAARIPYEERSKRETEALRIELEIRSGYSLHWERVYGGYKVTALPWPRDPAPVTVLGGSHDNLIEVLVETEAEVVEVVQARAEEFAPKLWHKIDFDTADQSVEGKPQSWRRKHGRSERLALTLVAPVKGKLEASQYVRMYWEDARVTKAFAQSSHSAALEVVGHLHTHSGGSLARRADP